MEDNLAGYSIVPHAFIENRTLSVKAKGAGLYLNSFPKTWLLTKEQLMDHFKFGDTVWRRISKELIAGGFLRIKKGRHGDRKGYLEFDIYGGLK